MKDIYNTLAKYLSGEASSEEAALIQQYKQNNSQEYYRLQALWQQNQKIKLTEFDTSQGWLKVQQGATSLNKNGGGGNLLKVVAIAAILLLGLLGAYYLLRQDRTVPVQMAEVLGTEQGQKVSLDDGSMVYLNKGAKLSYPETFDADIRELQLTGEAFFEVHRDPKRPFIVHTPHSDIEVLGTSFNINTDSDETKVAVTTGKVRVENIESEESSVLIKDQSATVTNKELAVFRTVDTNYLAWKTGKFNFENTGLSQVLADLESFYGDKLKLVGDNATCLFTSTFDNRDIKEIAEIIQLSCGLELTEKNGSYELH